MKLLLFSVPLAATLAGCGDDLELLTCKSTLQENAESVVEVIINHDMAILLKVNTFTTCLS